jgi:hypothetical protein
VLLAIDLLDPRVDASTSRRRMWRCHVPLFGATILAGIVRLVVLARVEYPGGVAWHWSYVLLAVDVMRRYLFLLIVPAGQTAFHAVPDVALFSVAGVLAAAVLTIVLLGAWLLRRAEWLASVGLCWFVIALVPSSALIVGGRGEPLAEHRVYLASCGLFLAIGAGIGTWLGAARYTRRLRLAVSVGFGVVLAAFSAQTVVRNALWHDPVALWQEAVERAPTHYRPRLLLGEALQDAGRKTEALDQFRTAVRLRPSVPDGYVKIGVCLITMGRPSEARPYLLDALARDPDNEAARRALALADRLSRS